MPDVKIKGYSGEYFFYDDVPKVWLEAKESTEENPVLVPFTHGELLDGVEIVPDFSAGDRQTVSVPDGYLVKEATILKPETLTPENVMLGVEIAGITGTALGDTEEVTVELDMADGDQIILPSADGKVISKATVQKPANLIPENIAEGVDIAGIIGTLAGGGGGGGSDGPVKMWSKTITGVTLGAQSSKQFFTELATPDELPVWADLGNIQRVNSIKSKIPIYVLGFFAMTNNRSSPNLSYEQWAVVVSNVSDNSNGSLGGFKVGHNSTAGTTYYDWFGTIPTNYSGPCVKDGAIYKASYNRYGGMSATGIYQLILIKIDPN